MILRWIKNILVTIIPVSIFFPKAHGLSSWWTPYTLYPYLLRTLCWGHSQTIEPLLSNKNRMILQNEPIKIAALDIFKKQISFFIFIHYTAYLLAKSCRIYERHTYSRLLLWHILHRNRNLLCECSFTHWYDKHQQLLTHIKPGEILIYLKCYLYFRFNGLILWAE